MSDHDKTETLDIQISNLTKAQAESIKAMLGAWSLSGRVGSSGKIVFMSGGGWTFKPEIAVNGEDPTLPVTMSDYIDGMYFDEEHYYNPKPNFVVYYQDVGGLKTRKVTKM